jgi:hypothetical protein
MIYNLVLLAIAIVLLRVVFVLETKNGRRDNTRRHSHPEPFDKKYNHE